MLYLKKFLLQIDIDDRLNVAFNSKKYSTTKINYQIHNK